MNLYDAGIALSGFSCFVTQDLARDLANDVMSLVSVHYVSLPFWILLISQEIITIDFMF